MEFGESDDDRARQVHPDMRAATPVGTSSLRSDVQIKSLIEVTVDSEFLNKSDGARYAKGCSGLRRVTGFAKAAEQVKAKSQGVWPNCSDESALDERSASACVALAEKGQSVFSR